ncbi:MAG: hypothetical protein ACT4PO_04950 [Actinomycetota bacterium]
MRALLEYLGFVEADRERREPVALPARTRWLAPLVFTVMIAGLAVASIAALALIRSIF